MDETTFYRRFIGSCEGEALPSIDEMPSAIVLPGEALGSLPQLLRGQGSAIELSQYVDFEVHRGQFRSSRLFFGSANTVVAADLHRPTWDLLSFLGVRRLVKVCAWHYHPSQPAWRTVVRGALAACFSIYDIVTIALLPGRLRSPIQIVASPVGVEALFISQETPKHAPSCWSPQGRPPIKLFRRLAGLLDGETTAWLSSYWSPVGQDRMEKSPVWLPNPAEQVPEERLHEFGAAYRRMLAALCLSHFDLVYYSSDGPTKEGPELLLKRVMP